ncbi:hypothetical protein RIF29_08051 [Crotalaria pallida]|uniref:Uncharacterized protein n=1 Tax=Crotalaria pallida TaxID=3830 RepID=A0AAN9J6I1_CROPI
MLVIYGKSIVKQSNAMSIKPQSESISLPTFHSIQQPSLPSTLSSLTLAALNFHKPQTLVPCLSSAFIKYEYYFFFLLN